MASAGPLGQPEPVEAGGCFDTLGTIGMVAMGVLGVGFILVGMPTTTRGATRSARIEWQARQAQIEQVIAEDAPVELMDHESVETP